MLHKNDTRREGELVWNLRVLNCKCGNLHFRVRFSVVILGEKEIY